MLKFIMPTILIVISVALFFTFTNPLYQDLLSLRAEAASYDEALGNSKALERERDKLTQKYNSIGSENLIKLNKLLPAGIDNIRLILEIERLALPYGMILKDVQYDASSKVSKETNPGLIQQSESFASNFSRDYGIWNLKFSTESTYINFINFVKDIESNLRIVDIDSVSFSSDSSSSGNYKYSFSIRTYWLKD